MMASPAKKAGFQGAINKNPQKSTPSGQVHKKFLQMMSTSAASTSAQGNNPSFVRSGGNQRDKASVINS